MTIYVKARKWMEWYTASFWIWFFLFIIWITFLRISREIVQKYSSIDLNKYFSDRLLIDAVESILRNVFQNYTKSNLEEICVEVVLSLLNT
jgi:hypothetical protein